jgi:hypothetical protein
VGRDTARPVGHADGHGFDARIGPALPGLCCKSFEQFAIAKFLPAPFFCDQPARNVPCPWVQLPTVVIHAAISSRKTTPAAWMT